MEKQEIIEGYYNNLKNKMYLEFPKLKMIPRKEVWWARIMDKILKTSSYSTTIGNTIALSEGWEKRSAASKYTTLLHEYVHLKQFKRWGLGSMMFGVFTMGILYLLVLPAVLTCRCLFEKPGYYQNAVAWIRCGYDKENDYKEYEENMLKQFTTKAYIWMCPFKSIVKKWAKQHWNKAMQEENPNGYFAD